MLHSAVKHARAIQYARWFSAVMMAVLALGSLTGLGAARASSTTYDLNTLAGKVAALYGTAGLQVRFSGFIEEEANVDSTPPSPGAAITPVFVLSSPLDGSSIAAPAVTMNQDTAAAPQNETAVAVDPNNPQRVVGAANDYVARTWDCMINGTPCSALGDGYSGTYYSNDGGQTWAGRSSGPNDLGTLIPGVTRLTGGVYDAGGDPALAFDSQGNVYYAGLGFNRTSAPNTVAVNKGTFDGSGALTWGAPVFINPTSSPSTLNDKEWIAADSHASSPFRDRVYVTWTRFIFNPMTGSYVQSPIAFSYSSDGGQTFSDPKMISGNVLYGQGSRPVVGYDGTVYVFWLGSTRLASVNSTYMVKSSDGGATWSKPVAVSPVADVIELSNTVFRNDSFPAAAVGPDGTLYAAWSTEWKDSLTSYNVDPACVVWLSSSSSVYANCHATTVWSKSTNGGMTWTTPQPIFPALDAANQTAIGYPVAQPSGGTLEAPTPTHRNESVWPGVAVSPSGKVYMSAYVADVVSPWQICANAAPLPEGRINCLELGDYIHNARLNYYVTALDSGAVEMASTHPINTRHGFGGGFIGDYTGLAVGSDNVYHAVWTDTNNQQTVTWFYGLEFTPTVINQQDVATKAGYIP